MSKRKVRAAVQQLDRLVAKVAKLDPVLAVEFDTLRTQIVNIESNDDWREHLDFCRDIARSQVELAKFLGVSEKTVQKELRKRGVGPMKAGRKPASMKYPFRISVPDSKARKS